MLTERVAVRVQPTIPEGVPIVRTLSLVGAISGCTLGNVEPGASVDDVGDGAGAHTKGRCEGRDGDTLSTKQSDGLYLLSREFGVTVLFSLCTSLWVLSAPVSAPALLCGVGHVLSVSADEKVGWVAASRVIA